MNELNLSGKVALVSGGSRGIGRAVAENLAAAGAKVVAFSRSAAELEAVTAGGRAGQTGVMIHKQADSTDNRQVRDLVDWTFQEFGQLDILVNNTGGCLTLAPSWKPNRPVGINFLR